MGSISHGLFCSMLMSRENELRRNQGPTAGGCAPAADLRVPHGARARLLWGDSAPQLGVAPPPRSCAPLQAAPPSERARAIAPHAPRTVWACCFACACEFNSKSRPVRIHSPLIEELRSPTGGCMGCRMQSHNHGTCGVLCSPTRSSQRRKEATARKKKTPPKSRPRLRSLQRLWLSEITVCLGRGVGGSRTTSPWQLWRKL